MRYRQIIFLIVSVLFVVGVYALFVMPRQEFPEFTIRQGLVIGVYPGATSNQVSEQLTSKVENYLFSYKEIRKNKTYSYSKNGMMIVFVTLNNNVNNSEQFWSKLNDGLNTFKSQLPSGVVGLFTNSDFGKTSALLVTLESDTKSYRQLKNYLDELKDHLRRIKSVSRLTEYGLQKEQVSIYLNQAKLTNYGITPTTLLANLFSQGFTTTGGTVDNPNYNAPIHIASYNSVKEIGNQIIYSDPKGNIIRLKDVARIVLEYPKPDSYITNNGHKCLLLSMEMKSGNNIVKYGKEVEKVLHEFQSTLPKDVHIERIANQPQVVHDSVNEFLKEMLFAIIGVILITLVLLPLRVAAVAASTIPITIFMSLAIMLIGGMELNTVTLAALIVVLGMIVDNSVVIVDNYMGKLDSGFSRWHAAIQSAKEFSKSLISATLAISVTFFPFLFTATGMIHDFVKLFPWTIAITLGISLFIALFFIPFIEYFFIKNGFLKLKEKKLEKNRNKPNKRTPLDVIQQTYENWLIKAFKHPKVTIGIGILSALIGIALFFIAPQRLMPVAERDQFAVEIYLPDGNSLNQTAAVSDSLEDMLRKDKRVKSITAFIGTSSPRFQTSYAPNLPAINYAQFIVNTHSNKETVELLNEYTPKYADYFPNAHVRFKQLAYEENAFPIGVRVVGDNISKIKTVADSLEVKLRKVQELTWVHTNFGTMLPGARINIHQQEASRLGISRSMIAANLAIDFNGFTLTTLWEGNYGMPVKLKVGHTHHEKLEDIDNEYIHSVIPGISVPLRQIANVTPDWTQGTIVRRNGVPTISILSDVSRQSNTDKVFDIVKKIVSKQELPPGVTIQYGGSHESNGEILPQMINGLLISIFIIFLILIIHFKRINVALLTLSASFLSLMGAVLGMIILHMDLGVTSILGFVSLIGIIVRNGIIMIDYAENIRKKHRLTVLESIFEAAKRRMRPIFLTSAAASMGVVPMIISKSPLWAPMGTIIFFGTMTSMVLLVLILPVAYWLLFRKVDQKKKHLRIGDILNNGNMKPIVILALLLFGIVSVSRAQITNYSLDQCKNLALENNTSLLNKNLDVKSAMQEKKAAFTKYFPQIDATALSFSFNKPLVKFDIPGGNLPVYDGNPANLASATQFAYFPGMSLSMLKKGTIGMVTATEPIFAGRQISTGNKLANLNIEVNKLQLSSTEKEVMLETEKQYWQIIDLKDKMKTLDKYVQMLDSLHKEVGDALNAGLITRNDLLKVQLKQNELQMNKLRLKNGIELAKMAFCQYIGLKYDSNIHFSDSIPAPEPPQLIYINHEKALKSRPAYKMLQKSITAEKYQTRMQRGEYMPQLGIGVGGQYLDKVMGENKSYYGVVFGSLKIPISGWWEASHKMQERKIKEEQNRNTVSDDTENLLLQMQQAKNKLDEAYQQIQLTKVSIQQAKENLKINQDNYLAGIINVSDMIDAQAQLQQSKNQHIDALMQYQISKLNYMRVTGR